MTQVMAREQHDLYYASIFYHMDYSSIIHEVYSMCLVNTHD